MLVLPPPKKTVSATESTCVSEFFAEEDALYYPVTEAAMPSILVGEESKDESNGQELLAAAMPSILVGVESKDESNG